MNLDDANVADEFGPDRFMPREVDESPARTPETNQEEASA